MIRSLWGYATPHESFAKAKTAVNTAIKLDETCAEAHETVGWIALGYDWDWKKAKESFERAIESNPNYRYGYLGLASYLALAGRFDEAIDELKKAGEDPNRLLDSYLGLAVCFREKNMFKESLQYLKKGINSKDISENKKLALNDEMAITYKKKGKARKAQKIFKQIYKTDSDFREVKRELAEESS